MIGNIDNHAFVSLIRISWLTRENSSPVFAMVRQPRLWTFPSVMSENPSFSDPDSIKAWCVAHCINNIAH